MIQGSFQKFRDDFKSPLGEPYPTRIPVIDKDSTFPDLRVMRVTNASDVVPVTKGKQGKDADGRMFNGMDAAHEVEIFFFYQFLYGRFDFYPKTDGLKSLGWQR
jgi:hypothetical protein